MANYLKWLFYLLYNGIWFYLCVIAYICSEGNNWKFVKIKRIRNNALIELFLKNVEWTVSIHLFLFWIENCAMLSTHPILILPFGVCVFMWYTFVVDAKYVITIHTHSHTHQNIIYLPETILSVQNLWPLHVIYRFRDAHFRNI